SSLSGAQLLQPNFWLDPVSGGNYNVIEQAPQHLFDSVSALQNIPFSTTATSSSGATNDSPAAGAGGTATYSQPQLLGNLATVSHSWDPAVVAHYTVQRVIDVDCAVSGRDLGAVTSDVERAIAGLGQLPPGTKIAIRGQSQAMRASFRSLGGGIVLAIVLVYLLMV